MLPSKKKYSEMTKKASPPSPKIKDFIWAYCVGGAICVLGQLFIEFYTKMGLSEKVVKMAVPVSIIFIAALLTGLGVFDKIARRAGAGTLVPITGFANAVVSPAIEFKNEGFILGVGAKIFTIAGPVIMYGTVASVIYGVVYWVTTLF
ncbi:MAG: stage V sporulation protein AC [Clostridia bacterium]|nr:stage V sporulation protein AC [Clostridia bacterium]